ncbi:putative coenzyme Q-binding protein COQ10, START [Helianthus annuus]|nr:putative coenzyme Q-binding protein COQ10, START [Helianthus annuus]
MLVSDQSLYSGHRNHHLSTTVNLHHSSSSKPHRKINQINNINRTTTTTRSFNFSILTSNTTTSSYNFSKSIRNNAINGSINGISAEEVVLYEEGGRKKRKVKCEVEVVSWRERRVKSEVVVDADVDSVWNALTDYERLADFIPNLIFRYCVCCLCCCGL